MLAGARHDSERPATYREVLTSGEFRAIYAASALSWVGDYLARAAVTVLVLQMSGSVPLSAAAFAISYAPWLLGGSVLVSIAERFPYRSVMVFSDIARVALMVLVALPGLPLPVVLVLLLASSLFAPPFDAARSATLPAVLTGDRYVVGMGLHSATAQPAQIAGYFAGASLAAADPRMALLLNALTFAASAILIGTYVQRRAPALDRSRRTDLIRETIDGFRLVFTTPALRAVVVLVFGGSLFAVVPEALAAAWAVHLAGPEAPGWTQGLIMASVPLGSVFGALTVSRFVAPARRRHLLRPLAVATPLTLVPAVLDPSAGWVALLAGACGFAIGGLVPIANGQFVKALPNEFRARAFGVVQAGLHLLQGAAVLVTGLVADKTALPLAVGIWSLAGVVLLGIICVTWATPAAFSSTTIAVVLPTRPASASDRDVDSPTTTVARPAPAPTSSAATPGTMKM